MPARVESKAKVFSESGDYIKINVIAVVVGVVIN